MAKKKQRKTRRDVAEIARSVVEQAIGEDLATGEPIQEPDAPDNSPGRPGGLVGGKARAAKLSPEERSEIARRAAKARWAKKRNVR